jgi:hypothetical protein
MNFKLNIGFLSISWGFYGICVNLKQSLDGSGYVFSIHDGNFLLLLGILIVPIIKDKY